MKVDDLAMKVELKDLTMKPDDLTMKRAVAIHFTFIVMVSI